MCSPDSSAVNRAWVRDILAITPALLLILVVSGLAFGCIKPDYWWLMLPCTGLCAIALFCSGRRLGDGSSSSLETSLIDGRLGVIHRNEASAFRPAGKTKVKGGRCRKTQGAIGISNPPVEAQRSASS